MEVSKLNEKLIELSEKRQKLNKDIMKANIYWLAQKNYERGDLNAFKFADQDCKILNL